MPGSDIHSRMGFGDGTCGSRDKHEKPGWKRANALPEVQPCPLGLQDAASRRHDSSCMLRLREPHLCELHGIPGCGSIDSRRAYWREWLVGLRVVWQRVPGLGRRDAHRSAGRVVCCVRESCRGRRQVHARANKLSGHIHRIAISLSFYSANLLQVS